MLNPNSASDIPLEVAEHSTDGDFEGAQVLKELKERLGEYLPFVSVDFVICDVCSQRVKVWDFPSHIEFQHFDPPKRVWSRGPKAGRRRKWKQLEKRVL